MKRNPIYATILAVAFCLLGYYLLLTHDHPALSAFAWWACGVSGGVVASCAGQPTTNRSGARVAPRLYFDEKWFDESNFDRQGATYEPKNSD